MPEWGQNVRSLSMFRPDWCSQVSQTFKNIILICISSPDDLVWIQCGIILGRLSSFFVGCSGTNSYYIWSSLNDLRPVTHSTRCTFTERLAVWTKWNNPWWAASFSIFEEAQKTSFTPLPPKAFSLCIKYKIDLHTSSLILNNWWTSNLFCNLFIYNFFRHSIIG